MGASVIARVIRVHQEDVCQASGKLPSKKYQSDGGPCAREVFDLIRNHSSAPNEDQRHFLDAMIYKWLIGGTDAPSKNYGFLLAGGHRVRLNPFYDISSFLPYSARIHPKKARLAMKIGGKYLSYRIGPQGWEKRPANGSSTAISCSRTLSLRQRNSPPWRGASKRKWLLEAK